MTAECFIGWECVYRYEQYEKRRADSLKSQFYRQCQLWKKKIWQPRINSALRETGTTYQNNLYSMSSPQRAVSINIITSCNYHFAIIRGQISASVDVKNIWCGFFSQRDRRDVFLIIDSNAQAYLQSNAHTYNHTLCMCTSRGTAQLVIRQGYSHPVTRLVWRTRTSSLGHCCISLLIQGT